MFLHIHFSCQSLRVVLHQTSCVEPFYFSSFVVYILKTGLRRPLCCEAPETFCGRQLSLDFPSTFSVNCSLNKFFSDEMGYPGRGLLFVNLLGKLHLNHSIIEKIKIKYVIHKNHEVSNCGHWLGLSPVTPSPPPPSQHESTYKLECTSGL